MSEQQSPDDKTDARENWPTAGGMLHAGCGTILAIAMIVAAVLGLLWYLHSKFLGGLG